MSKFIVHGRYKAGKIGKVWQSFTKEIESQSEKNAIETAFSLMGSEHGLKRNLIKIDEVSTSE
jgi:large subunit ribosomal protein LX